MRCLAAGSHRPMAAPAAAPLAHHCCCSLRTDHRRALQQRERGAERDAGGHARRGGEGVRKGQAEEAGRGHRRKAGKRDGETAAAHGGSGDLRDGRGGRSGSSYGPPGAHVAHIHMRTCILRHLHDRDKRQSQQSLLESQVVVFFCASPQLFLILSETCFCVRRNRLAGGLVMVMVLNSAYTGHLPRYL